MTKLKLILAHGAGEILTRDELKKVIGGTSDNGSSDKCAKYYCGAEGKPCCSAYQICSDASKNAVCVKRPL